MPATVTLTSTTLLQTVGVSDSQVVLASTTGLVPGMCLFVDRELMGFLGFGPASSLGTLVNVRRGLDGTTAQAHSSTVTVYIGTPDQFYHQDPWGRPDATTLVSPWINVRNGAVWFAQGDATPSDTANRWWQQRVTTYDVDGFGNVAPTVNPTAST